MEFLFSGHSVVDLLKYWLHEGTWMFNMRSKGDIEVDMFKVLGERQVLSVINVFVTLLLLSFNNNYMYRFSLLSGRSIRWPRCLLPPGESR